MQRFMQLSMKLQWKLHTVHGQARCKHAAALTKGVLPVPVARRHAASRNILVRAEQPKSATQKNSARLPTTFASLGLEHDLASALDTLQITQPTEIQVCYDSTCAASTLTIHLAQALALPRVIQGGDFLMAAHTGSGKTLAYLLPLVCHPPVVQALGSSSARAAPLRALPVCVVPCNLEHTSSW